MTSIPSFGASLLSNPQSIPSGTKSAEDIINAPQHAQIPDSFAYEGQEQTQKRRNPWIKPFAYLVGIAGLFVAGRQGVFGKHIRKWFGGLPSSSKVAKNIETKMQEYLGKAGVKVNKVQTSATDNLITYELENGSKRLFKRYDTNKFIRLEGMTPDGKAEMIVFRKEDGSPVSRTLFTLGKDNKITGYKSFKDATVLDANFDEAAGVFKSYEKGTARKRILGMFGRTQRTDVITRNNNPDVLAGVTERTLIYDKPDKVTRIIVKNPDGTSTYKKLVSQTAQNSDGTTKTISKFVDTDSNFKPSV